MTDLNKVTITGQHFINGTWTSEATDFNSINPVTNEALPYRFANASQSIVESAVVSAKQAFIKYRGITAESRAAFLEAIADESPFMPGKLAEFIGLNKTIWALSPQKSETRRILGKAYPWQCEAKDDAAILDQLNKLVVQFNDKQNLGLKDDAIKKYVSPEHVVEEMNRALKELA